jgi:predicted TPR repeat methyltransferase
MKTPEDFSINLAYSYEKPEDLARYYDDSASQYDDYVEQVKYVLHLKVAAEFVLNTTSWGRVLDVGCGTGCLGEAISNILPSMQIDGVDISQKMLDIASTKQNKVLQRGSYKNLFLYDVTKDVLFTDTRYDAIVSSGVFTTGHLMPENIAGLLRLLRGYGLFVASVKSNHFEEYGFENTLKELFESKRISLPSIHEVNSYDSGYEAKSRVVTFRKLQ